MKTMPKSTKEEKFRWIKPILDREISIKNMDKICLFSERSIKYWLDSYKKCGIDGLKNKSARPKTNPKETSIQIKEELIRVAPFRIKAIKTDNGSNFTNRYTRYSKSSDPLNPKPRCLDILCQKYNIIRYLIDPGKPAQNGKVERSEIIQGLSLDRDWTENMSEM